MTTPQEPDLRSIWAYLDNLAFTQGYANAGGLRTRYVQAGPKEAPALIMVHGMGGSWENFIANFRAFAQHFNTYAFDLLGHGYTDKPDREYAVEDYVAHLKGFIAAMGLKKAHLLGLSLGAWTSTKFTVRYPELVDKLMVLSAWGRPRSVETPESTAMLKKLLEHRLKTVDEPTWPAINEVFETLIAKPEDRATDILALRLRLYRQPGMSKTMRNVFAGVSPELYDKNLLSDEELKSVSRPTLVVACTDHQDSFLKMAHDYKKLIPNAQWAEVLGASHWPQWEKADDVNRIGLDFFRS